MQNFKNFVEELNEEQQHSMTDMYRHIAGYHHHMNKADDAHNKGQQKKKESHYKQADNHLDSLYKKHGKYLPKKDQFKHYDHSDHESASEFVHYAHPKGDNFHETGKNGKKWS